MAAQGARPGRCRAYGAVRPTARAAALASAPLPRRRTSDFHGREALGAA
ncbi:hypothetical protein [Streptomyces sp. NPDC001100]